MHILRGTGVIFLLILVLMSSSSFIVGMHFCRGHIKNVVLFDKAAGCENEKQFRLCPVHDASSCCRNEIVFHDGEDFSASQIGVSIAPDFVVQITEPPVILCEIVEPVAVLSQHFYDYDAPLRDTDLTVTLRVFLI